jgi:potassium-transporting ATPase ATP-binding subunit
MTQTVATEAPHALRIGAGLLDPRMLLTQLPAACGKLNPRTTMRNPVMFVVEVGAALSTVLAAVHPSAFAWLIVVWLWATAVFANLAEAVAEGRGKAQAASLRRSRQETTARLLVDGAERPTPAAALKVDDRVVCEAGDLIPSDGDVIEGIASVDESSITWGSGGSTWRPIGCGRRRARGRTSG